MKKILLLISGLLILSLSGAAMASSIVLNPSTTVYIGPNGAADVSLDVMDLDNDEYTIELVVVGQGIEATISNSAELGLSGWATEGTSAKGTFTYAGTPLEGTINIKRTFGESSGLVNVLVYDGDTLVTSKKIAAEYVNVEVPEFPTVALPVAAILGLVFIFGRRKEGL